MKIASYEFKKINGKGTKRIFQWCERLVTNESYPFQYL